MLETLLFAGCVLAFAAFVGLLFHFRTGLFGLTALCVFHVAAATLSVFFFGYLLDDMPVSVTAAHDDVWTYSVPGLLAMIAGVFLGWRPLKAMERGRPGTALWTAPHVNEQIGWLSFWTGAIANIALRAVWEIPTLSTAVNCLGALARIGILILLVAALGTGRWRRFVVAAAFYMTLSIVSSLESGYSFLRIDTILPMIVILIFSSRFALRYAWQGALAFVALIPMISAWLETRSIIREGSLIGLSIFEKAEVFFGEFFRNVRFPTSESFMDMLVTRVDMTAGLAAQVLHQPDVEPYAYGETFYSALYTLIPRFAWPEKPIVAGGSEFYAKYTGLLQPEGDITSIGIAYPFELYANGGPYVVIVGLAVIGFLCARLELKLLSAPRNLGTFWALALVTAVLCDGGQRTDVVLPALVAAGLAAYALGRFVESYFPIWDIEPHLRPSDANSPRNAARR
jgi:hypothetical protein